jgi:hypothetical protein
MYLSSIIARTTKRMVGFPIFDRRYQQNEREMVLVMNSSCSGVNRGVGRCLLVRDVLQNDGEVVRSVVVVAVSLSGRRWCLFGRKTTGEEEEIGCGWFERERVSNSK